MKKPVSLPATIAGAVLVLMVIGAPAVYAGSLRYGGPEGLFERVRAEIVARRPHPQYVPTPFTAAESSDPAAEVAEIADAQAADVPDVQAADSVALPVSTPTPAPRSTATAAVNGKAQPTIGAADSQTSTPTSTNSTPSPDFKPPMDRVALTGIAHYWQTWNNCGPDTLAMNLSYFGSKVTQADVAAVMRPYKDDKNVNPEEMADFARSQGFSAVARVNGDALRLRTLLSNGVPVMIETWLEPKPNDGMGHFRLLTGYDDARQEWIAYDSYDGKGLSGKGPYAGIRLGYAELDRLWAVFNRSYVVVYDEKHSDAVKAIIGADMDDTAMWQRALAGAQKGAGAQPKDAFALFNVGSSLTALGRYKEAAAAFDQARVVKLPWRMLWYQFAPLQAYYEVGRYREVVALVDATANSGGNVEELFFWKGLALQALGDKAGARAAFEKAIRLNTNYRDPVDALAKLGS